MASDFHRLPSMTTDVLVLGSGVAGLSAAIEAARVGRVIVACKGLVRNSATDRAQGGIAAAWSEEDSIDAHADDTLRTGCGLCIPDAVHFVVERAPEEIRFLESLGARFDCHDHRLDLAREGGHGARRVIHAGGDATGAEIMRTLLRRASDNRRIHLRENCFALDLLTAGQRVVGALIRLSHCGFVVVKARVVILATGGAAAMYRDHTNPPGSTGDGLAMALRAGTVLRDMEFVQFHPTVFHDAGGRAFLMSEALRGEGALLRDADGCRFMPDYDERAELAPRDVVSRAIHDRLRRTSTSDVFLDVRHIDSARFIARFPQMSKYLHDDGLDPACQLIPVRPAAHYTIGGIATDLDTRTNLDGLLACGEVASSGLHGANRLASNSLLEGMVFGHRAGMIAVENLSAAPGRSDSETTQSLTATAAGDQSRVLTLRERLGTLMQRGVGIERDAASLRRTLDELRRDEDFVLHNHYTTDAAWEMQNLWMLARCTTMAAEWRCESRGTHFRTDYPKTDDTRWRVHSLITLTPLGLQLRSQTVASIEQSFPHPGAIHRENDHRAISNQVRRTDPHDHAGTARAHLA